MLRIIFAICHGHLFQHIQNLDSKLFVPPTPIFQPFAYEWFSIIAKETDK